ncbi:hypothetical protein SCUP515_03950 [Seiridium cupressi]
MLFSKIALAALAGQVAVAQGERKPYRPELVRMSVKDILLGRRQEDAGYQPDTTLCGTGTTCAEACGAGFEQCASSDEEVHCYDAGSQQTCCPNNSGDSCDAGYYCSADTTGATYCCPSDASLDDCAATFSVTGGLSSQIPVATSTSLTVSADTTTTSTSSTTITVTTTKITASSSSTTSECTTYTSEIIIPISASSGYNTTVARSTGSFPTSSTPATTSPVQAGASSVQASALVAVVAVAVAALV